jgi:hypothetical protein
MTSESDEDIPEVEIIFNPRAEALTKCGISEADFEAALSIALDRREVLAAQWEGTDEDFPALEEMSLRIGGVTYKLEDLADVDIRG